MPNRWLLFVLGCLLSISTLAQFPSQRAPSSITVMDSRLKANLNLVIPIYPDTATANANIGLDSLGALMAVRGFPVKFYIRDSTLGGHRWTLAGTGGGGGGGDSTAIWGYISGTLSAQTDLQTALNGKQNNITIGSTAQYFRGDLSLATFPTNVSTFTNDANYLTSAQTQFSVSGAGTSGSKLQLVNDASSPGASKYYGTDGGGTKGFFSLPAAGTGTVTSAGMTGIAGLSVSGSPITTTGTFVLSTTLNTFVVGTGSGFRNATSADFPNLYPKNYLHSHNDSVIYGGGIGDTTMTIYDGGSADSILFKNVHVQFNTSPQLLSSSAIGQVWTATDVLGHGAWSAGSGALTRQLVNSGTTITVTGPNYLVNFDFSSPIATFTATLPSGPSDKDIVQMDIGGTQTNGTTLISSFTVSPNSGQTIDDENPPSVAVAGQKSLIYQYRSSTSQWYRKQ